MFIHKTAALTDKTGVIYTMEILVEFVDSLGGF